MNGFKKYKDYNNSEIYYKIVLVSGKDMPTIEIVFSSPRDIWELNDEDKEFNVFYFKTFLNAQEWSEIKNYPDGSMGLIVTDFNNAVEEFNQNMVFENYKTDVNIFLLSKAKSKFKEIF